MKRIHYFSGVTLSLFIGVHLSNHLLVLGSEAGHIAFMEAARKVYLHPIAETLILLACLVQTYSGIQLVRKKGWKQTRRFDKLHVYSGLYLAVFLIAHPTAILILRYYLQLDTNLYLGAVTVNMMPILLFFMPYYMLGILSFFVHIACIHRIKIAAYRPKYSPNKQAYLIIGFGLLISILIILGLTNFGQGMEIPQIYRDLYGG